MVRIPSGGIKTGGQQRAQRGAHQTSLPTREVMRLRAMPRSPPLTPQTKPGGQAGGWGGLELVFCSQGSIRRCLQVPRQVQILTNGTLRAYRALEKEIPVWARIQPRSKGIRRGYTYDAGRRYSHLYKGQYNRLLPRLPANTYSFCVAQHEWQAED